MTVGLSGWKHGLAFWQNGSDLTPHLLANLWLVSSICYTEVDIVLPSQGCLNMERNNGWKMLSTESGAQKVLNKCSFTILKIDIYLSIYIYLPVSPWLCVHYELSLFQKLLFFSSFVLVSDFVMVEVFLKYQVIFVSPFIFKSEFRSCVWCRKLADQ